VIHHAVRRLHRSESGFTVVEGLVAALILVMGGLAALQVFDAGARNTYRSEESQVLNDRLQAELEAVRQLPYAEIAMTSAPQEQANTNDPRWRVQGTTYAIDRDGSSLRGMVFNGGPKPGGGTVSGGTVDPGPTPFTAGDVSGQIYRFITWTSDATCPTCGAGLQKRVIVAATINQAPVSSLRSFQELHTDVIDPEANPDDDTIPEDPEESGKAEFWLTDTPCSFSSRQPIGADHLAHNTRGVCSQGPQTGSTRGAPDLMFTEPQFGDPTPPFDYATDSEPTSNADQDKGILMPWGESDSCVLEPVVNTLDVKRFQEGLLSVLDIGLTLPDELDGLLDLPAGDPDTKHQRIHTWVSPPVQSSGGALTGRGTLELYTKTINGAVHPGEICVWLSVRQTVPLSFCLAKVLGVCVGQQNVNLEVDLPYINVGALSNGDCRAGTGLNLTNFSLSQDPWPAGWEKVSVPMCFAAVNAAGAVESELLTLPQNSRVVLSIMVKQGGTEPGQGLDFMYDSVSFESRLELETNQIIQF
jgi:type II secretory pathway pseudopilin PulG